MVSKNGCVRQVTLDRIIDFGFRNNAKKGGSCTSIADIDHE